MENRLKFFSKIVLLLSLFLGSSLHFSLQAQHLDSSCKCKNCQCKTQMDTTTKCGCGTNCKCKKPAEGNHQMHNHNSTGESHPYMKMMDEMMQKMHGVTKGKTVEAEFIMQMIAHHQGAVDMANYQIKNGTSTEMIQLAKSILSQQKYEIELMKKMLEQYPNKTTLSSDRYFIDLDKTMAMMMAAMPANETKFTSIDQAFAQIMLPHHQAAIDMCRVLLEYSKQKEMQSFAQTLIAEQIIEIEQMQEFIKFKK